MKRSWITYSLVAVVALGSVGMAAQDAVQPKFEVASIKENKSGNDGGQTSGVNVGHYTATNIPLYFLVLTSYQLLDHQLAGMPEWTRSTAYDISAGYPPELRPDQSQLRGMVRALLEDRFHLVAHHEMRQLDAYALTLARKDRKLGPQMSASNTDCARWLAEGRPQIGAGGVSAIAPGGKRPECLILASRRGTLTAGSKSMLELAVTLQSFVGRPVIDRTGLAGVFNMDMQWTPSPADASAPTGAGAATDVGASLFTALQEQLGLKLESTKASFDVLVIDRIERPTPD
jgi:uncharacterized protein (TIGR03435 family)